MTTAQEVESTIDECNTAPVVNKYLRQYATILRQTTEGTDALAKRQEAEERHLLDRTEQVWQLDHTEQIWGLCRTYEQRLKAVEAQRDEALKWKEVLLDQGVVCWVLTDKNKDDPRRLINDLCCRAADEALDPAISDAARKLQAETVERCAKVCEVMGFKHSECPEMSEYCADAIRALKVDRREGERRICDINGPDKRSGNDRRKK